MAAMFRPTRAHLLLGCLAAALAAFSSANGFLLCPVGLLILFPRRAYAESLAWCASFALPLAAYLYHYNPYHHSIHAVHAASLFLTRPFYFLAFLGCAIPYRWPAALLGIVVLAIFSLAVSYRFDRTNPVMCYFAVWIMATGLLVAWARGSIASRYSIYSSLLLIFCYFFLAQYLPICSAAFNRRRWYVASVVFAVVFCSLADARAYKHLGIRRRMVLSGIELYRANPKDNSPMINPEVERVAPEERMLEQVILSEAIEKQIYRLPPKQDTR